MTGHDDAAQVTENFFTTYTKALLERDAAAIADHYAVPALIEFPQEAIAVTKRSQTEDFFEQAFAQYANVTQAEPTVTIAASGPHSIWADVSWEYHGGAPAERNMYQLTRHDGTWRIAVLTPLADVTPLDE